MNGDGNGARRGYRTRERARACVTERASGLARGTKAVAEPMRVRTVVVRAIMMKMQRGYMWQIGICVVRVVVSPLQITVYSSIGSLPHFYDALEFVLPRAFHAEKV